MLSFLTLGEQLHSIFNKVIKPMSEQLLSQLKWTDTGLIPAIVQDDENHQRADDREDNGDYRDDDVKHGRGVLPACGGPHDIEE